MVLQKAKSAVATADNSLFTELPTRGVFSETRRHKKPGLLDPDLLVAPNLRYRFWLSKPYG
jgi:hypothetical protein